MSFRIVKRVDWEWITRPHEPGEPARQVAELSELAGFDRIRGNVWRYEPGAIGKRHQHQAQAETFVVLEGTLSIYLGDPPVRHDLEAGELVHVNPGTPLQSVNHGETDLLVYVYGTPPEDHNAEILESAV